MFLAREKLGQGVLRVHFFQWDMGSQDDCLLGGSRGHHAGEPAFLILGPSGLIIRLPTRTYVIHQDEAYAFQHETRVDIAKGLPPSDEVPCPVRIARITVPVVVAGDGQPGAAEGIQARDRRGEQIRLVIDQVAQDNDQVQVFAFAKLSINRGAGITQLGGIVDLGIADECHPEQGQ